AKMDFVMRSIVAVRTIKAELGVNPAQKVDLILVPADDAQARLLQITESHIKSLARVSSLTIDPRAAIPKASSAQVVDGCQIIVPLAGLVNIESEIARLDKEVAKLEKDLVEANKKLHNESFVSRAPAEVVEREKEKYLRLLDSRDKLSARRAIFAKAEE
ncbi:MAG: valine--tRNA ligase, partial [Desulfovibrio sp.]|nr:valine--tRNA ligase [Desulfovibrio sp.]